MLLCDKWEMKGAKYQENRPNQAILRSIGMLAEEGHFVSIKNGYPCKKCYHCYWLLVFQKYGARCAAIFQPCFWVSDMENGFKRIPRRSSIHFFLHKVVEFKPENVPFHHQINGKSGSCIMPFKMYKPARRFALKDGVFSQ